MTYRLKELERLCLAATPGPWEPVHKEGGWSVFSGNQFLAFVGDSDRQTDWRGNAEYISAANPDTILKMVELIGEMEKALRMSNNLSNPYHQKVDEVLIKYKEWAV